MAVLTILLLELCVFGFCFFQDRNIGIGVFPEGEEILVGGFGVGGIASGDRVVQDDAGMMEDFLELACRCRALVCRKVRLASHVNNV